MSEVIGFLISLFVCFNIHIKHLIGDKKKHKHQ